MKKSKLEKAYHDYLAGENCIACGSSPVTIHHVRSFAGVNAGIGTRSSHYLAIPLCPECHQGQNGIHHNKRIFEMRFGTETELVSKTIENLWRYKNV